MEVAQVCRRTGADLTPSVSCKDDAYRPEMPVAGGPLRLRVLSVLPEVVAGDGRGSGWRGALYPLGLYIGGQNCWQPWHG